jgi:hypothetical protein
MKNFTKRFIGLLFIIILFSCKPYKVIFSTKKSDKIDKIAVVSTFIGKFQKGWALTIYGPIMAEKINSISGELNILFKNYADIYRDTVASALKENCNCEVIYGESLHNNPGFKTIKDLIDYKFALSTKDENFPKTHNATGDINPFQTIDIPTSFLDSLSDNVLKITIPIICKNLDVNFVAVTYSFLSNIPGDLFTQGSVSINPYFFLYDKYGDCIAWGYGKSGTTLNAGKIEQYPEIMNMFPLLIKPIIKEISKKYTN